MALNVTEQKIVADAKAAYSTLSNEAKAELAKAVSWAERYFTPAMILNTSVSAVVGWYLHSVL